MTFNNFVSIVDLQKKEFASLINKAQEVKKHPKKYKNAAFEKSLLMIFEAPSLRTRLSFETAMTQLHGEAINYYTQHSPWGMGKESIEDVAKVISRYCDIAMARIYSHDELKKLAKHASIPIINAMTNDGHPCQILGDFLTMKEKHKRLNNLNIAYLGDAKNNVTYSLMRACTLTGNTLNIGCPAKKEYYPEQRIIKETRKGDITITANPEQAVKNADIIYTDSWMSYRIAPAQKKKRIKDLKKYQVNKKLFTKAKKALFMHCLPALRGMEVTSDVIDSKRSIVFDQAENRMHSQKALILKLLKKF